MYQLTIDTGAVSRTTGHAGQAEARQALLDHAIEADLYLHGDPWTNPTVAASLHAPHVSVFRLLRLDPTEREPRCVGTATITAPADTDAAPNPHLSTTGAAAS
jgi:hypothetical protein